MLSTSRPLAFGLLIGILLIAPSAAAGTSLTAKGAFVATSFAFTCVSNPDGTLTCAVTAGGFFEGTIMGIWALTAIDILTPGAPFDSATFTGSLLCQPCMVAGLSGSITFSVSGTTTNIGLVTGSLTITEASGGLKRVTGSGGFHSTVGSKAMAYTIELTFPS